MTLRLCLSTLACVALAGVHANAQDLFLLPGASSSAASVQAFSSQLAPLGSFLAGPGSFIVAARSDGAKFYVISNGSSQVTAVDSTFQTTTTVATLSVPATAAAITPNGARLLVLAGTLHIFDTSTSTVFGTSSDNDLTGSTGLAIPSGGEVDFAISLDGKHGYLLCQNAASGSTLYEIDLTSTSPTLIGSRTISIVGPATGVSVAPSGLIYVSTTNLINEINPNTFQLTATGNIGLNSSPGKAVFTPDGHYLLAPNNEPLTGPWVEVDLTKDAPVDTAHTGFSFTAPDILFPTGDSAVYGYSTQAQTLYHMTLTAPVTIEKADLPNVPQSGITAPGFSPEVPGGSVSGPHYFYFVSNDTFYRLDLTVNQIVGQVTLPETAAVLSEAGAAFTGAAATLLSFGTTQTVAVNGTTLPLVVRALDANGLPLSGVTVAFATTNSGVTIANPSVTTGSNGYASTTAVTASSSSGLNVITATAGSLPPVNFKVAVGSGSTGSGQSGFLQITSGQGIVAFEDTSVGNGYGPPLTVQVTDLNGNPVPKTTVTFTNTTPLVGSLSAGNAVINNGAVAVTTDVNGKASASFVTNAIQTNQGHSQAIIRASSPGTDTATFYLTVVPRPGGNGGAAFVDFTGTPAVGSVVQGNVGGTIKNELTVRIYDGQGLPIPNVSLRMVTPGSNAAKTFDATLDMDSTYAVCAGQTGQGVLTNTAGAATCNLQFLQQTFGATQAIATDVGYYLERSFLVNIGPGLPAVIKLSPTSGSGNPGQAVSSVITVTDGSGNPLSGVGVTFQIQTANTINLAAGGAITNSEGQATLSGTLGGTAGTFQILLSTGSVTATFTYTVTIPVAPPGAITPVSGGNQTTTTGTQFTSPVVVMVSNASGADAGVPVTFTASNGATLSNANATTDANGNASTLVTAGSNAGTITVTAATSNNLTTSFTLTAILPGPRNLVFVNGASFQTGIAPGVIATLDGDGLTAGIEGVITPYSIIGPLPLSLAGVSVTFNGIAAPIYWVANQNGKQQVTLQVPFEITPGTAAVVVTGAGGGSTPINVPIQAVAPGMFETQVNGQNFLVAIRQSDGTYISASNPAHPKDVICFFVTGLGQTTPALITNDAGVAGQSMVDPMDVGLNNAGVPLISATTLVGEVGVYMVCMQVPSAVTTGPRQPVGLVVHDPSGDFFAQGSFIPIQ